MRAFLINLSRRTDRLAQATRQLRRLAVPFTPVIAIDAMETLRPLLAAHFAARGPLGEISSGDMACTLSHLRALEMFRDSGEPYGIILEDDICLSDNFGGWARDWSWLPAGIDLVKLERFGPLHQCVVTGDTIEVRDRMLRRLLSKHCGAAAYVVSRHAAVEIIAHAARPLTLPIDHLLFNPNNSPLFEALLPWQLLPAICEQHETGTDIHAWRRAEMPRGWRYVRREALRGYYEFRKVPKQVAGLLSGRAGLLRVSVQ